MNKKYIDWERLFHLRTKGFNNQDIANELGLSRNTISTHMCRFKKMDDEKFIKLKKELEKED